MKVFIGNLSHGLNQQSVLGLFAQYGKVESVELSVESVAGRSSRFAFVIMPDSEQAIQAIVGLNQASLNGRILVVNEARPVANGGSGPQHHRFIRH